MEYVEISGIVRHVSQEFVQVTEYGCRCGLKYDAYLDDHSPFCDNCEHVPDMPIKFKTAQIVVLQTGLHLRYCLLEGGDCNALRVSRHTILSVHATPHPRCCSLSSNQVVAPVYAPVHTVAKIIQNGAPLMHLNEVQPLHHDPWIHRKISESLAPLVPVSPYVKEALVAQMANILDKKPIHILITGEETVDKGRLMGAVSDMAPRSYHAHRYYSVKWTHAHDGLLTAYLSAYGDWRTFSPIMKWQHVHVHENFVPVKVSVLLHCPPKGNGYDSSRPVNENIYNSSAMEQFDTVCVLRNNISEHKHLIMADAVLNDQGGPLSVQTCRSYLEYVSRLKPAVSAGVDNYVRKCAARSGKNRRNGSYRADTLRKFALASARLHWRAEVTKSDVMYAVNLLGRILDEHVNSVSHGMRKKSSWEE